MPEYEESSHQISKRDQGRIDSAVRLGAIKQVQLVKFIYDNLGFAGITKFVRDEIEPWARSWARSIRLRHGLQEAQITARVAIQQLYPEVHDHTAICSDHLDMFFSIDHEDLQVCGARYCPVAYQWMQFWPQGAHHLCYIYSYSFDRYFFAELNPNLHFTKHAECCADQPGIPHGRPCLMRLETRNKPVDLSTIQIIEDAETIEVSKVIKEFLAARDIQYELHVPKQN